MGPGKAKQWGLADTFNDLTKGTIAMCIGRCAAVLPVDQWMDTRDRPRENTRHPCKTAVDTAVHAWCRGVQPERSPDDVDYPA
eukprot:1968745-Pyramimonas_sp.AAC.1